VVYTITPILIGTGTASSTLAIRDTESPESFKPIVTHDPLLDEGKWVALFQTQDKNSGLKGYQIQESKHLRPDQNAWVEAQSPYVLKDQSRSTYVFIKAIDYQGNERIEIVNPEANKYVVELGWALCIILTLLLVRNVYYKYGKKRM
jgi:hypothetical protein